ncbi:MAG: FkbM family methyltransferase [Gaiella sp.]|nr:FkbM family methyltransferase [Gaiella sp.]
MGRQEESTKLAERTVDLLERSAHELLEARRAGPVVVSYAQNAEDVRLWRVFAAKRAGFYVDVGAGDPITHSVTKLFYDAGWNGINIEPGPAFDELCRFRERDVNLDVAVASEAGEADLWVTSPEPGLSSLVRPDDARLPRGFTVSRTTVRKERLEDLLRKHAAGREIDFLKIDAEGAERDVLESLDLREFRPRIVVAEAVSALDFRPAHEEWEPLLVEAGYVAACFDGVNRFYVDGAEAHLVPALAYPITLLDRYVLHDSKWRRDSSIPTDVTQGRAPIAWGPQGSPTDAEVEALRARQQLQAIQATLSWRVTRPLRTVRRLQLGGLRRPAPDMDVREDGEALDTVGLEHACVERLLQATSLFAEAGPRGEAAAESRGDSVSLADAASALEAAIETCPAPHGAKAWLALTAVDGRYPDDETVDAVARLLRASGPRSLAHLLQRRFEEALRSDAPTAALLDVVRDGIVIVSESTVLGDLHTGIQRVARETVSRWLDAPSRLLAFYDADAASLKLLSQPEHERVRSWRDHMPDSGAAVGQRTPEVASDNVLVPWNCRLLVTELLLRQSHSRALATIARVGVSRTLSFICFDLIPVVAPETVEPGLAEAYCGYLAAVKRADHVSAISEQSARDFRAYVTMLETEGLNGPEVRTHALPTPAPSLSEADLAAGTAALELEGLPLVLVVGVHVPRKNHAAVLEASERLWMEGNAFELLFIGGFDRTSGRDFDGYVHQLRRNGWPVRVRRRASETELWAAYARARFTVYPSLLEGFGLPVAESLASGTPVITSSHGSMAEIGRGGGTVLVDPRDIDELTTQMRRLLEDDELLERLRHEARARDLGRWDDYARDVWEFFTAEPGAR